MSSEELASLLNIRHDNVRQAANNLKSIGVITFTEISVKGNGRPKMVMQFDRRNSIVMAAKLNDRFMGAVVDRWIELETPIQSPQLPQSFAQALQLAANQALQLEQQAPKVEFHDKLVNNESSYCIRDAAKSINQRPNKFKEWLRDNKYLCMNSLPMQRFIDQGLFVTHTGISESDHEFKQARMTNKGLAYFTNKLGDAKL